MAEPNFVREMATSAFITLSATLLALISSFLAAYALWHARFRAKAHLIHSLLILASLPVMAYAIPLSDLLHRSYQDLYSAFH